MSEEILRALMQLFAIIIKQDGGLSDREKEYVRTFLVQQIGVESAEPYFRLFLETAEDDTKSLTPEDDSSSLPPEEQPKKLTSVLDSVKILRIGKKINKTLNQRQKIVVLVRTLELINTEYKITGQRVGIVKTVAEVFKVSETEYNSIYAFVTARSGQPPADPNTLEVTGKEAEKGDDARRLEVDGLDAPLFVLRVPSVELYFIRYTGDLELYLNGLVIRKGVIHLLANGSSIRFPRGVPLYYSDIASRFLSDTTSGRILFEARDLSYTFPGGVKGLQNIRFTAEQNNLVGILGSSGSGKTTLLNLLSGIYTPSGGTIRINGHNLQSDSEELRGVMGHVPQDDLLIEELTVFENLWYNARFCFSDLSDQEIREKVNTMLENLGLTAKAGLKVGSVMNKTISGGQRKRLNIALELIREPSILLLDEPTSGLSSRDSENVMDLLRELTLRGKLVFVVIHQPGSELFKMFDRVVILDEGGRMVYYGNPVEAVIYFKKIDNQVNYGIGECPVCGNVNPEQIFNIIEARQVDEFGNYTGQRKISPKIWEQYFHEHRQQEAEAETPASSEEEPAAEAHREPGKAIKETPGEEKGKEPGASRPAADELPAGALKPPGWAGQFVNYLKRDFTAKIRNRQYLVLMLSISPVLALILSYIIRYIADPTSDTYIFRENENIPIYIFMAIIVALFLGLIISAEEIFRDRKILKRERFLHLSRSSYLVAKIVNLFLLSALQSLVFILIANNILGIRYLTFAYWLALFSVAACANMLGLIISSAFNSAVTIYILIPLVMIPMMVLSGAMFSFEKLNRSITRVDKVPLVAEGMPTKWAYEALMVKQFKDNQFEKFFFETDKRISRANFKSAYLVPGLEERLNDVSGEYHATGSVEEHRDALEVLKNEVMREQQHLDEYTFAAEAFEADNFSGDFEGRLRNFLEDLNQHYLGIYSKANREKQRHINKLLERDRRGYFQTLNRHHNEAVSDHVKKIYEKNQVVEANGHLYQQIDPIFRDPRQTGPVGIRSHFFAPRKPFFGTYVDTYVFNIAFIWLLTLLGYGILYFDLVGRVVK